MFEVVFVLQIIAIVLLLVEIFYMIPKISGRSHVLMFLFVVEAFVDSVGYLLEMSSATKETAFMGTKINYIGRAYLLFTIFLFVLEFCKIKLPAFITFILFLFHSFVLGCVLFAEHTTLYYSSISFVHSGIFPHLELGHGVLYRANQISMILYLLIMFVLLAIKLCTNKSKLEKKKTLIFIIILSVSALSLFAYSFGLTGGYDSLGFAEAVSAVIMLFGIFRCDMLSSIDFAKGFLVDTMETGVVVLDDADNLLYSNAVASKLLPDLSTKTPYEVAKIENCVRTGEKIFSGERVYMVRKEKNEKNKNIKLYVLPNITNTYNYLGRLEREVEEKTGKMKKVQNAIIVSFANIVETRDGYAGQHIENTSNYVQTIVHALNKEFPEKISEEYMTMVIDSAPMHDIGKISIPDSILCKAGKLTDEEFEIMKTHCKLGAEIITNTLKSAVDSTHLEIAVNMASYHHEKWDGSGYPSGLKGEEIPLCARIMAVADVFDSLCSRRCYKDGFTREEAIAKLREGSGTDFDPFIVKIFLESIAKQ